MNPDEEARKSEATDASAMEKMLQDANVQQNEEVETHETPPDNTPASTTPPAGDKPDKVSADTSGKPAPTEEHPETETQKTTEDDKGEPAEDKGTEDKKDSFTKEIDNIKLRKDASPRTREAFDVVKAKAKAEHEALVTVQKQLKEKEGIEVVTPEVKKEIEGLRQFKQTFDIENDPKFAGQFNQALEGAEQHGLGLLLSWKLPESAAKYIKDTGGLLNFRYSTEFMPETFKNTDGTRMTRQQWWDQTIMSKLDPSKKDEINDVLSYLRNTSRQKQVALQQVRQNKDAYFQQQKEIEKKSTEDWMKRVQTQAEKVLTRYGDVAKEQKIEDNDTPEVKASKEKHNQRYHQAEKIANKFLAEVTPESLTESAIGMGYLSIVEQDLKDKDTQLSTANKTIKDLSEQLKKIKDSSSTGKRITMPASGTKVMPAATHKMSDEQAMEALVRQNAE
jgi:hypothetical protein